MAANLQQAEKKLRKLNQRYKDLGRAHGLLCVEVDRVRAELAGLAGRDVHLPALVAWLGRALQAAKRSHQPGPGAALPAPLGGPRGTPPATVAPGKGQTARHGPPREPLPAPSPSNLPPLPPERLLAALQRGRAALVTRQAQLAACRTCGTDAAAYEQAAADVETLMRWVARL
jgi:hypothetical protein